MDDENKPQFDHDCSDCTFLGRYAEKGRNYDLYFCPQGRMPTVIARYGSQGSYYTSGLIASYYDTVLAEGRRRAQKLGLVSPQPFGPQFTEEPT